jgi:hypothetical protein
LRGSTDMAEKISMTMTKNRDTKNMTRYGCERGEKTINLYLPNADLEKLDTPDSIRVVVTAA